LLNAFGHLFNSHQLFISKHILGAAFQSATIYGAQKPLDCWRLCFSHNFSLLMSALSLLINNLFLQTY